MRSIVLAFALAATTGVALAATETVITNEYVNGQKVGEKVEQREYTPPPPDMSFETADKNHDGSISPEEARDMGILNFEQADLNHDGRLDREEYERALSSQ